MSAWGFIITPVLIASDPSLSEAQRDAQLQEFAPVAVEEYTDVFDELTSIAGVAALDDSQMANASGGTDMAIDIANLGVNVAENNGSVSGSNGNNSITGDVSNNTISNNSGVTTVLNNSGNGVVMQSIVNLNIFLQGAGPQ
ncbi:MAG: hypothetical protein CMI63_09115 [Parvularcula sp.]|nr:hypothetical protein [Parvularcula sp.]